MTYQKSFDNPDSVYKNERVLAVSETSRTESRNFMSEKKAIICPGCGKLVSNYLDSCPYCGLKQPGKQQRILSTLGFNVRSFVKPIIFINVALFIISFIIPLFISTPVPSGRDLMGLLPSPSYVSLNLLGWADIRLIFSGNWWVLVTAMFLHGGVLHILFNMMWVRDLGPQTEYLFGPHKMLTIFILSGIAGNLVAVFTPLLANSLLGTRLDMIPVIGASGAVFGLMGAIIAFGKKRGGIFGRHLVRQMGMWALILIVMGFLMPGISNAAHIGGFIGGFLLGLILSPGQSNTNRSVSLWIALFIAGLCGFSFLMMVFRIFNLIGRL